MSKEHSSQTNSFEKQRLSKAVNLFNSQQWYKAHDLFEEIWHETLGPERLTIQGILQVSVAQYHMSKGNLNGATILLGEAVGRLKKSNNYDLGFDIKSLITTLEINLSNLQNNEQLNDSPSPRLISKYS